MATKIKKSLAWVLTLMLLLSTIPVQSISAMPGTEVTFVSGAECTHVHDAHCGFAEAAPCTYKCECETTAMPTNAVSDLVVTHHFAAAPLYTTTINIPTINGNAPAAAVSNPPAVTEGTRVELPAVTANPGFTFNTWQVTGGGVAINNATSASDAYFMMGT